MDINKIILSFGPISLADITVKEIAGEDKDKIAEIIYLKGIAKRYTENKTVKRKVDINFHINYKIFGQYNRVISGFKERE